MDNQLTVQSYPANTRWSLVLLLAVLAQSSSTVLHSSLLINIVSHLIENSRGGEPFPGSQYIRSHP